MLKINEILERGVSEGVYPGAVLLLSAGEDVLLTESVGFRSIVPERSLVTKDTIFDLASLTKPLGTVLAVMSLVDSGKIKLDQTLSEIIDDGAIDDKADITVRLLLNHSGGLRDWKPFYMALQNYPGGERKSILRNMLVDEPLEYKPGTSCLYSDLGFMILEWIIEKSSGMALPEYLDQYFYRPLSLEKTFFNVDNQNLSCRGKVFALTEACPWRGKILNGVVHDENAFVLGGAAGHAGLFSTAGDVHIIADMLLRHFKGKRSDYFGAQTVREFFRRQGIVDGCTWALGWDTPSRGNSSSGRYFSRNSVGHLGYSGTSIWMDLDREVIVIFLTNRVHPTRENQKIKTFRPMLHNVIIEELKRKGIIKN
ncbi:MAG: beta-lactamase family protein [Deltaproteobacteria bacterium]|nr:beta-lactamase family protein [Deltaproteobacteria bacterium]